MACLTRGTPVRTLTGLCAVERLQPGDQLRTRGTGRATVEWIGMRTMRSAELRADPGMNPILIKAGALGQERPMRDLIVSPQLPVFVGPEHSPELVSEDEVPFPAERLLGVHGVERLTAIRTEYVALRFEADEVIEAGGAFVQAPVPIREGQPGWDEGAGAEMRRLFPSTGRRRGRTGDLMARSTLARAMRAG